MSQPTRESRLWSVTAHLGPVLLALASAGTLAFVAPLSVWLLKRNDDTFVREHARRRVPCEPSLERRWRAL